MPSRRVILAALTGCLLVACLGAGGLVLSRSTSYQLLGEIVAEGPSERRAVALTFDDGPTAAHTATLLALLQEHETPATFFLLGKAIEANPDASRAIARAGHEIGNHSFSHQRMVLKSRAFIETELARTDAAIRAVGYDGPIHFRPPFGKKLIALPRVLASQDRLTVMWSVDGDPIGPEPDTAASIAERVLAAARPGSIILLHPMYEGRAATRAALPALIEGLRAEGYDLVTVSAFLGR